ncbi:hypothetical protein Tco_1272844 [Tanacetum coccineum]
MAAPLISISLDSSKESVGSFISREILFGTIPVIIHDIPVVPAEVPIAPVDLIVALEVGAVSIISPTGVLDLTCIVYVISSFFGSSFPSPDSTSGLSSSSSSFDSAIVYIFLVSYSDFIIKHIISFSSSGQSHSGPSTREASPRWLISRYDNNVSDAYMRWRSVPLSTLYPPTTSESSPDSSFESLESTHMMIRNESIRVGTLKLMQRLLQIWDEEEIEAEASTGGTVDIEVDPRVGPTVVEDVPKHIIADEAVEITYEPLCELIKRFHDHAKEIPVSKITDIETTQRQLEVSKLIAGEERVSLTDRVKSLVRRYRNDTQRRLRRLESFVKRRLGFRRWLGSIMVKKMTITRSGMTPEAIEELVNRRVEEALAAYEVTRAKNALEAKSQSQNSSDGDNGNGGNGNGRNENPNENGRGDRYVVRECTYQDFIKCQPLNFKGTKGVVGLIRWFEKMETMFHISNCLEKYQVKYATCTLLNSALTWWNSHKMTIGTEAAFTMSWRELMKLMAEVYCPRNEIQKMEKNLEL